MKVYAEPESCRWENDYSASYNREKENIRIKEHQEKLAAWLRANGYNGKRTGEIFRTPVADGYAMYMLAEGSKSILIHLTYNDGYSDPNVQYLPKKVIVDRIEASKRLAALFTK
jgi:hypothetical protein